MTVLHCGICKVFADIRILISLYILSVFRMMQYFFYRQKIYFHEHNTFFMCVYILQYIKSIVYYTNSTGPGHI